MCAIFFIHVKNGEVQTEVFGLPDLNLQPLQNQYINCPNFKGNVFKKHTVRCSYVTPTETEPTAHLTERGEMGYWFDPIFGLEKAAHWKSKFLRIKSKYSAGSELLA